MLKNKVFQPLDFQPSRFSSLETLKKVCFIYKYRRNKTVVFRKSKKIARTIVSNL